MSRRLRIKDHPLPELREALAREGVRPYRADQLAGWIYRRGVEDPERMTDLGRDLRARLAAGGAPDAPPDAPPVWELRALELEAVDTSHDGTRKATLVARDGARVEAVWIPEAERATLCVSAQVGCAMACDFCATGSLGFRRNLATSEIVDQVCRMREVIPADRPITNVVFMGMGEPLLNLDAVVSAVRLFVDPKAFGFAPRRVTVSTVGLVPKLGELLERVPANLAVSLHATTDAVRDRLVPLNRRYPLEALLGALRGHPAVTPRRPVFFEYTLMEGVNDSVEDARRLPGLLHGIPCKVNLIPMNPHPDAPYRPPSDAVVDRFLRTLAERGMTVTLRRSRGPDIQAACGQLALRRARAGAAPHAA